MPGVIIRENVEVPNGQHVSGTTADPFNNKTLEATIAYLND
ncbi:MULTISPECIES: hypothetical protein [Bacteria]|nr:hypothetical protein [Cetobacterium somerae]WVJ03115.1 hypothetical protein VSU16_14420 [Cetobacterium somerae]